MLSVLCFLKYLFLSFQLELRRKQFHVLLSTIHELQQTLESKWCSWVFYLEWGWVSADQKDLQLPAVARCVQLRLETSWISSKFFCSSCPEPETAQRFFSPTNWPLCHFLTSFRLVCRQQTYLKCGGGEWQFEVVSVFKQKKSFLQKSILEHTSKLVCVIPVSVVMNVSLPLWYCLRLC